MHTKIIATIGPASESQEMIEKMVEAGMEIARINFSHCTPEEFKIRVDRIRKASKKFGKKVAILQDLQGPRIRVGLLPKEGIPLSENQIVKFSTSKKHRLPVIYVSDKYLHLDLKPGDPIFLHGGLMELKTISVRSDLISARVIKSGILYSRNGINVPRTKLTSSGLTGKDKKDIKLGLKFGVDYIAMSFVQNAQDIKKLKSLVKNKVKVISKIESAIALNNLDEIIKASDAIMVARGDLGVEMPVAEIPFIQKQCIHQALWHKKGSIVATQMLTSMMNSDNPTRAEVSDIVNAVWEGANAIMLSNETASGHYPLEALKSAVTVVRKAEATEHERRNYL